MAHPGEGGADRNEGQDDDRMERSDETTGDPDHPSKAARMAVGIVALIVVITLTGLFVSGSIRW